MGAGLLFSPVSLLRAGLLFSPVFSSSVSSPSDFGVFGGGKVGGRFFGVGLGKMGDGSLTGIGGGSLTGGGGPSLSATDGLGKIGGGSF